MRVVLAGGGTAGHIEPALAVAAELIDQKVCEINDIIFLGGKRGLESRLVPAQGFNLEQIDIIGLPRKFNLDFIKYPLKLLLARQATLSMFSKFKPDLVIGFGGYVSAPGYLAAKKMKIPFVIHEANARPGVANAKAAKFATKIIDTVSGSIAGAETLGVPIRKSLASFDKAKLSVEALKHFDLPAGRTILVFGGSQGAERLNQAVVEIVNELTATGINIIHIAGNLNFEKYQKISTIGAGKYLLLSYCDRMDFAYAVADLAITRSGALTVAELACVGLPAILVPYPVGNGEQRHNAAALVNAQAAVLLENKDCTGAELLTLINNLFATPEELSDMAQRARSVSRPNAATDIVNSIRMIKI
jgi:UDP-N-acetylglucosamine--N-acetylmuramyl-(pentapeptide) pyrophosphoryl-undecaprenol N-acetylglucosamine transferase